MPPSTWVHDPRGTLRQMPEWSEFIAGSGSYCKYMSHTEKPAELSLHTFNVAKLRYLL